MSISRTIWSKLCESNSSHYLPSIGCVAKALNIAGDYLLDSHLLRAALTCVRRVEFAAEISSLDSQGISPKVSTTPRAFGMRRYSVSCLHFIAPFLRNDRARSF